MSAPFSSFDTSTFSDTFGAVPEGADEVDLMLEELVAEVDQDAYGAFAPVSQAPPDKLWKDFVPRGLDQLPGGTTDNMALEMAQLFGQAVKAAGWPQDLEGRMAAVDGVVTQVMFRGNMVAVRYYGDALDRTDVYRALDPMKDIVRSIYVDRDVSGWSFGDVDDMIQDAVSAISGEDPALEEAGPLDLSEGDINELAVLIWSAQHLGYPAYQEIVGALVANPAFVHAHEELASPGEPIDLGEETFTRGGYTEISPVPPTSAGISMPKPETILGIGYLLSVGPPMLKALFGNK